MLRRVLLLIFVYWRVCSLGTEVSRRLEQPFVPGDWLTAHDHRRTRRSTSDEPTAVSFYCSLFIGDDDGTVKKAFGGINIVVTTVEIGDMTTVNVARATDLHCNHNHNDLRRSSR
jgi:hypothetical protein